MSSLTGLRRTDGQRVSPFLGSLLGSSTLLLSFAAKYPTPPVNALLDVAFPLFGGRPPAEVTVSDVDAGGLPAKLYSPPSPTGLIVYFHGGGFVVGSLKTHRATLAFSAKHANCQILAVGYRKAPAHPFPAALEDCVAAWRWAVANADSFGVEPGRMAVGGDSAGAQLAAATCLELGDDEPRPRCAWLLCPLTDAIAARYDSARLFARGPLLTRENVSNMVGHYATAEQYDDPRLTLMNAEGLDRMPPTYVATAGMDPIRDQGERFAEKLRDAGVDVSHERFPNLPHDFQLVLIDPGCRRAAQEISEALGRALAA